MTASSATASAAAHNEDEPSRPVSTFDSLENIQTYLFQQMEEGYSAPKVLVVPLASIVMAVLAAGCSHDTCNCILQLVWNWILLPLFRIAGIAVGIGLGLGLATHVHDCLEVWHSREEEQQECNEQQLRGRTRSHHSHYSSHSRRTAALSTSERGGADGISTSLLLRKSSASNLHHAHHQDDETSYLALMTNAGYNVLHTPLRGQIVKQPLLPNYIYTPKSSPCMSSSSPNYAQWRGVEIMQSSWPQLPSSISLELGKWIEFIVRDYVASWYSMVDAACPYDKVDTATTTTTTTTTTSTPGTTNDNHETNNEDCDDDDDDDGHNRNIASSANGGDNVNLQAQQRQPNRDGRYMVSINAPHRPLPLMTTMYHSLAVVFGNLTSRAQHVNILELLLLKVTKVLALELKAFRELKQCAMDKQQSSGASASSFGTSKSGAKGPGLATGNASAVATGTGVATATTTSDSRSNGVSIDSSMRLSKQGQPSQSQGSSPLPQQQQQQHRSVSGGGSGGGSGSGVTGFVRGTPVVSEMAMAKEFLLADKLHKAVTFGMDVPSLLFADASGKECNVNRMNDSSDSDGDGSASSGCNNIAAATTGEETCVTEEQVLEQRLFGNPQGTISSMVAECQQDYNRVLAHRLCKALLPRSEFSSPIIRTLLVELVGGCVLQPIMLCFSPDYVNSWIATGLESILASSASSASTSEEGTGTENDINGNNDRQERQWDFEQQSSSSSGNVIEDDGGVELELMDVTVDLEDIDEDMNEAIEVIRNPTTEDEEDGGDDDTSGAVAAATAGERHAMHDSKNSEEPTRCDSETVAGDYILPLLTMAVIDLERFVDFASFDPEEDGTNWNDSACQDAVRQLVLVIEAALIHGRRRQRLTKRKRSMDDVTKEENQGDTLLPFFSSNLSQVLMELTSDIDAFGARIAMEETRLRSDENGESDAYNIDSPSMSCKPSMSELSSLRTLIAAWLHTGQVYKMLSVLIQARQSILIPYFHKDAFLRVNENAAGFVSQIRALDGVEIMVDTTSILASSGLDAGDESPSSARRASSDEKPIAVETSALSGNNNNNATAHTSPLAMASSLTQSMARGGGRLKSRFMSGVSSGDDALEYSAALSANKATRLPQSSSSSAVVSFSNDGPTPRYLDFHRNKNFALSLRTERDRRKESWNHVCASTTDQGLKIVHRVKGASEEDWEDHRALHRLSRTFYSGTNTIALKDGTRRKQSGEDGGDSPSSKDETNGHENIETQVVRVSLLTVEMVGQKRRIEIPDDDSSFLIRAQPRPLKAVGMHIDKRDHSSTYRTFAATYEEAAVPSGSFRYSGGRYIRKCTLKYFPNDRTATIELPPSESARTLDSRKARLGPPTSISIGPPKAQPLSGDFLRKHHLCQKWVPRGAAPRSGSSILASPTMEPTDFYSVPRAGKSIDFVYRMSLFEYPMVELSGKKFTIHDSSAMGSHRADASSMELSDASLTVALLTAGRDWEHRLSEHAGKEDGDEAPADESADPGVEMGPDGYPIVWIKLHKKQGEQVIAEIKPFRASYMRAAILLSSARQEAQRQCLEMCVRDGSARNATRARVDSYLRPAQRLLEFATSRSREKQSILMRDLKLGINHVDREQLRRNKLLYPRYPTNIRSLTAVVEDSTQAKALDLKFSGASPTTIVYKVRCVAIVELVGRSDEEEDWPEYDSIDGSRANVFREEWVVYRQFRDFNVLHKHLKSQVAVSETSGTASSRLVGAATAAFTVGAAPAGVERRRKALIPSLGQANKAGALGITQKAIEKRRNILHTYLQHLLAPNHPLRQCSDILTFLGAFHPFPSDIRIGDEPSTNPDGLGRVGMVRAVFGGSSVTPSVSDDASGRSEGDSARSTPQKTKPRTFSAAPDSMTSTGDDVRSSRRRSSRVNELDMDPAIKVKIDKVPLGKVRNAMFELIRSQFDFENASFFRNRLVTALKTMSFAVASNGEFRKSLYDMHKSYLNPDAIAGLIKLGLEMLWPNGVFYESSPALTPQQSKELADKAMLLLVNAFPDQVRSILGTEITEDGLQTLHEMLQNRLVLKSLSHMLVDLLLLEVFPEFQDFLTGGAALESDYP